MITAHFIPVLLLLGLTSCTLLPAQKVGLGGMLTMFVIEEQPHGQKLRIYGYDGGSWLAITYTSIRADVHGSRLDLTLRSAIDRPGCHAAFDIDFQVPPTVDEVRFGTTHTLIWDRTHGVIDPILPRPRAPDWLPPLNKKAVKSRVDQIIKGAYARLYSRRISLPVPGKASLRDTSHHDYRSMPPASSSPPPAPKS